MYQFSAGTKKLFLFVCAAKIFILGVFLIVFGEGRLLWADSSLYLDLGRNIWLGNGFGVTASDGTAVLNTRFMPLYPAVAGFFSLVPHGLIFLSLVQAAIAAGIAVFVYKIGLFFLPRRWALGTALIVSFEPLISAMHILMMPETVFVFFLTGFLYFFLEYIQLSFPRKWESSEIQQILDPRFRGDDKSGWKTLLLSLVALLLAAYTKPAALYLSVLPVLFLIFAKRQYARAGLFAIVFALAFIPWMARNAAVGGSFTVTNDDIGNICGWTLHGVLATKYRGDPTDWNTTWNSPELLRAQEKCTSPVAALRLFLMEYPGPFVKTMVLSSLSLLTNDGYSVFFEKPQEEQIKPHHNFLTPAVFANADWWEKFIAAAREYSSLELIIIGAGKIFWLAVSLSALWGVFLLLRRPHERVPALFLFIVILYFVSAIIFSTAYGAGARLRYPIDAPLLIFAAYGIVHAVRKISHGNEHTRNFSVLS